MLTLEQAVLAYREEYLVERGFGRVISKPLMLSPMYVQSDQRATGLIHLLSMALRILTILEGRCRQRLAEQHTLGLLDVSPAIYDQLGTQSPKPP